MPRSWLIMVSLCTILHGHGILAKIMARSWQDLGKASKEVAMDLGKGTMASNTGYASFASTHFLFFSLQWRGCRRFDISSFMLVKSLFLLFFSLSFFFFGVFCVSFRTDSWKFCKTIYHTEENFCVFSVLFVARVYFVCCRLFIVSSDSVSVHSHIHSLILVFLVPSDSMYFSFFG